MEKSKHETQDMEKQNTTQDMIQWCKSNTRNQKPDTTNKNRSHDTSTLLSPPQVFRPSCYRLHCEPLLSSSDPMPELMTTTSTLLYSSSINSFKPTPFWLSAVPGRAPWQTRPPGARSRALRPGLALDMGPGLPPGRVSRLTPLFSMGYFEPT